ncbi:MAG: YeeE/YedE family protein [Bauldia sp.]|nr:YeeE/YedE family protein [Bauldia sp.]
MRRALIPLVAASAFSGTLFGIGLAFARMTDPKKIKDFLDFSAIPHGGWDPSLLLVMGAASVVAFFGLRAHRILRKPLMAQSFSDPWYRGVDRPLLFGSALFGLGWGLAGLCPGPAIADLAIAPQDVVLFVGAMLAGSWLGGLITWPSRRQKVMAGAPAE